MPTEQEIESGLEKARSAKVGELEAHLLKNYGQKAVDESKRLAQEVSESSGVAFDRVYASALFLAQFVGDFRRQDTTRLYRCPCCLDKGWQILEETEEHTSCARPCPACDLGAKKAAFLWYDKIHPVGRSGQRFLNDQEKAKFEREFEKLPTQRAKVIDFMEHIERGGRKRKKPEDDKPWE